MTDKQKHKFKELEQYDFIDGDYIDEAATEYAPLIGTFLIRFSELEHELNIGIADVLNERSHEPGFVVLEKLTMSNKVDLLYKLYLRIESFKEKTNKDDLDKIKEQLGSINAFRNQLVHANRYTLTREGDVRTRIVIDNQEGFVKFQNVRITPQMIELRISEIDDIIDQIGDYKEVAFLM